MAKRSQGTSPKSKKATETSAPQKDVRERVVDALMALAAEQRYQDIGLMDIAQAADLSLAQLRDLFPSKDAILGAVMRIADQRVLAGTAADMDDESGHDRLMDVMLRRFDALGDYREGLRSIHRAVRHDPAALLMLNGAALNSWRYMLEAAGISTGGTAGAVRAQGAAMVFARAFPVWLDDEPDLGRTMARLDRELRRGAKVLGALDAAARLAAPFQGFARAVCERRRTRRQPEQEQGA